MHPLVGKKKFIFLLLIILSLSCQKKIDKKIIIDHASLLKHQEKHILQDIIINYEKETLNEIIIIIINSLKGEDINKYALKKHNELKIGKEKYLNGVLIVISKLDRKIRINVGYGLESTLTNDRCKSILDKYIIPKFKNEEYFNGLIEAINQIKIYAKKDWE